MHFKTKNARISGVEMRAFFFRFPALA